MIRYNSIYINNSWQGVFHISWHWIIMSWIIDVCYDECMHTMGVEYEIYWRRISISATTTDVLLFMSHLWLNYWSCKVPQGTKRKIWTRSLYALIPNKPKWFGCNSLSKSSIFSKWYIMLMQAVKSHYFGNFFFKMFKIAENGKILLAVKYSCMFWTL